MQQQQRRGDVNKCLEEYRDAQRAAMESIQVGRATADAVHRQGEQLRRADALADDTQYKLDRATRILKGMTWSGWVTNLFTADVKAPDLDSAATATTGTSRTGPVPPSSSLAFSSGLPDLSRYEEFPASCRSAVQSIRNYHANVTVLSQCETAEQKDTCVVICDSMYGAATSEVERLQSTSKQALEAYMMELRKDLETLRRNQKLVQNQIIMPQPGLEMHTPTEDSVHDKQKEELFGRKPAPNQQQRSPVVAAAAAAPSKSIQEQHQDQHLEVIAASLGELGSIANSLREGLHNQNGILESLDGKSENVLETSKMVSRRADRLVQKKLWTPVKPVFAATITIRHKDTGKYLAILASEVYLVNQFNPITCSFDLYKRQGSIVGLQSHANRRWLGQSFLTGALSCAASAFGRREELELDSDWKESRLLCASAGWGQGGYLQVNGESFAVSIGGLHERKKAAVFVIINQHEQEQQQGLDSRQR
jgi:hypothetical protein